MATNSKELGKEKSRSRSRPESSDSGRSESADKKAARRSERPASPAGGPEPAPPKSENEFKNDDEEDEPYTIECSVCKGTIRGGKVGMRMHIQNSAKHRQYLIWNRGGIHWNDAGLRAKKELKKEWKEKKPLAPAAPVHLKEARAAPRGDRARSKGSRRELKEADAALRGDRARSNARHRERSRGRRGSRERARDKRVREHPDRREHEHRGQSRAAEPGPSRPRPEAPEAPESAGRRNDNDGKDSPGSSGYSYYTSDEEDKDEKPQQPKVPAAKPKVAAAKIDPPPTAQKKGLVRKFGTDVHKFGRGGHKNDCHGGLVPSPGAFHSQHDECCEGEAVMGYTAAAAANPRATSASHDKASQDFFGASRRPALTKQLTVCQKRFELSKLVWAWWMNMFQVEFQECCVAALRCTPT